MNKVTGISKLKKNQQPTQIPEQDDMIPTNNSTVNKAKSLGKKNGGTSIREKTAEKYGKNAVKANRQSNFTANLQQPQNQP